jgi:hypothetical protein
MRLMLSAAAVLILAACNQAPQAPEAPAAPAAPAAVEAPVAPQAPGAAPAALPKAGDSYWTARKALLAAGFAPIDATEPVDGLSQDFMVCAEAMEAQQDMAECPSARIALVEVEGCAGTGEGNCLTRWRAPDGRTLTIYTVDSPQPGVVSALEWSAAGGSSGQG